MEHNHADDDHEEVYALLEGSGQITVENEEIALAPGDTIRVASDATRELSFDEDSTIVIAGAP